MHDHNTSQLVQIAPLRPQVQKIAHAQKPHDHVTQFLVGLDIGSTTVKAVIVDAASDQVLWQDYQRHETKQPEKSLEFLKRMEAEVGINRRNTRMFVTGSGGGGIAEQVGAKFVQEVTAVSLAVEKLHPEVYSVIELGGQDAKIIVFKDDDETGRKKKIPSMNDKCAGGTGAVIDKINAKLKIPAVQLGELKYQGIKLHKVAGKCGVFAETDINGLQKVGTPPDELMASLFEAIVLQNLSVLTRGHTLRPHVLLLGGPNSFIRGMREAWQANIPRMWQERKVAVPDGAKPEDRRRWIALGELVATQAYRFDAITVALSPPRSEHAVHTLADLTGLKVGVEIHGLPDLIAMTYRQGALAEQVVHVTQARALFAQLESGDIDAALVDERELDAWRLSHSGTRVAPTGYRHSIGFNIGFVTLSTNGALIDRVNAALAELLAHGNLIEIARANGMTYSAPRSPDVSPEVALDALSGD